MRGLTAQVVGVRLGPREHHRAAALVVRAKPCRLFLLLGGVAGAAGGPAVRRSFTDVIHRTIDLPPLAVAIIDTPEFQRLRGVTQLGVSSHVFPCAVHDRFQHSLGVAHLASSWTRHFQTTQPELAINEQDVLCVTLAGLIHDLGHGPLSHFWEHDFVPAVRKQRRSQVVAVGGRSEVPADEASFHHEPVSVRMFERLLSCNGIDVWPWLSDADLDFV